MAELRATTAEYAALVLAVAAVAGSAIGGVWLRAQAGPARQRWLELLAGLQRADSPWVRIPASVDEDRLLGGLDLGATLSAGKPVLQKGLLPAANGGCVELRMAERQSAATASALCGMLDHGALQLERDGFSESLMVDSCVVACDEALADDEPLDARLADRLGLVCALDAVPTALIGVLETPVGIDQARHQWRHVVADDADIAELQRIADALHISSPRPVRAVLATSRVLAALHGLSALDSQSVLDAAALCLISRVPGALQQLLSPPPEASESDATQDPPQSPEASEADADAQSTGPKPEEIAAATAAVLPDQLLAGLATEQARHAKQRAGGKANSEVEGGLRGKPMPSRGGLPRGGRRLDVLATLKAAAPWQKLRGGELGHLRVQRDDLKVRRFTEQTRTTTIFIVDASGSAAVQRLAETKGAIELLLAECYVRRDQVALVAFRGAGAEILLPATRSLVRAKRALASLPGGGGTPLAAGLRVATQVADAAFKRGETPVLVLLSDGRGNITLDGDADPSLATEQALAVAGELAVRGYLALAIDTGRRPSARSKKLAEAMQARYLALPHAGADEVNAAVREVAA
ncbi:MAG: magnesium chelatase subunit D [Pseudomonadota bacterium]